MRWRPSILSACRGTLWSASCGTNQIVSPSSLESTPLTDEDRELLFHMPLLEAIAACLTIRMGEAATVEEALRDWIERRVTHERALEHRRKFQIVDDARTREDAQKPTDGDL